MFAIILGIATFKSNNVIGRILSGIGILLGAIGVVWSIISFIQSGGRNFEDLIFLMAAPNSPGWYPAPDGNGQQWWNGAGWSESRRNADGSTPGLPGYQAAPPAVPAPSAPVPNAPVPNGPVPLGAPNPYAQPVPSPAGRRHPNGSRAIPRWSH